MKLTVRQILTKDLVPYANNARVHSAEQVDTICASIQEFGFNDPVGVWTNKKGQLEIVEGHGRVLAAQQLGIDKVPTINLDHLTDEQRRAYAIVHNATTDNSVFDFAILDAEVGSLEFDWEEFGVEIHDFSLPDDSQDAHETADDSGQDIECPFCGMSFKQ